MTDGRGLVTMSTRTSDPPRSRELTIDRLAAGVVVEHKKTGQLGTIARRAAGGLWLVRMHVSGSSRTTATITPAWLCKNYQAADARVRAWLA